MRKFTVTKANFLDWYFNTGADQDQSQTIEDLGQQVADELMEKGKSTITAKNIWDECEHSCIPLGITEEFNPKKDDPDQELMDLDEEWKITLVEKKIVKAKKK